MNAVIIAAGMGTRLRPITLETPKPLIKVLGKPMLERNIDHLIEIGIKEIVVVVGYLKEKFQYLEEKYKEVKLIVNDEYEKYNNIYSFYLIREYLENTLLLDGDIYIPKNFFPNKMQKSTYFSKILEEKNNEWQLIKNAQNRVIEIKIGGKGNHIISGVSFFTKDITTSLKTLVEKYIKNEEIKKNYFWDDIVRENIEKFDIEIIKLSENSIYEIDTLEELKTLDNSY